MNPKRKTAIMAASIAAAMLGLAYASVPLYDLFCRVTGFGGTTQKAEKAPDQVAQQTIRVRFDGNVRGLTWSFGPEQRVQTLKIGQEGVLNYIAVNTGDKPVTGTATFNVAPDIMGQYFMKIQCFCFTEQTLQPGERKVMPVYYFIDPEILNDPVARKLPEVTLSYTFFAVDKPAATASAPETGTKS